jgi:hypothetical protein
MTRDEHAIKIAGELARKSDDALMAILDEIGLNFATAAKSGRLEIAVWPDGAASYLLDGKPILSLGPVKISTEDTVDGYKTLASREVSS